MLRLSKLADYAVVVMIRLGEGEAVQTAPGLSRVTGVPEPTVAKVLKALAGGGLVASQRGAHGGYRLSRPLHGIAVSDVIAVIDGPIALTACVEGGTSLCQTAGQCPMHGRWNQVNDAIRDALAAISLADMAAPPACAGLSVPSLMADLTTEY